MSKYKRVLSIDGGGIRAILPSQILVHLERSLQEKTGDPTARIVDYFDLITGTSTGAFIAFCLLSPDKTEKTAFSASEVADLLVEYGHLIFDVSFFNKMTTLQGLVEEAYPTEKLEELLRLIWGSEKFSELLKPCLVPMFNVTKKRPEIFSTYQAKKSPEHDFLLIKGVQAAMTLPAYFDCNKLTALDGSISEWVDGSMVTNNPSLLALTELQKAKTIAPVEDVFSMEKKLVLSLGTGKNQTHYNYCEISDWGGGRGGKTIFEMTILGNSEMVHHQVEQLFQTHSCSENYLRINPGLPGNYVHSMDDPSSDHLKMLADLGEATGNNFATQLDDFVDRLLEE